MDYIPIADLSRYILPALIWVLSIRRISIRSAQLHMHICCTDLFPKSSATRQIHSLGIRVLRLLSDSTEQFLPPRVFLPIDTFSGVRYAFLSNQQVLFAQLFSFRVWLRAVQAFSRRLPLRMFMISGVFGQVKLTTHFSRHGRPSTRYALTFFLSGRRPARVSLFFRGFVISTFQVMPLTFPFFFKAIKASNMPDHCVFVSARHTDSMCLIPHIHFCAFRVLTFLGNHGIHLTSAFPTQRKVHTPCNIRRCKANI